MPDVAITEVEYSGPPRRSRNLEERLMVRFPALFRRLFAFAQRRLTNPRSRLRRALVRRANISGWAAFSRRDFKSGGPFSHPTSSLSFPQGHRRSD